jgi:hypothetical protein
MRRVRVLIGLALVLLILASCAPGPNPAAKTPNEDGKVAGFWWGLWQGIIAPITFVISLFDHNVTIYEVHNNGGWYNLGFLLGVSAIPGGGGGGACYRRRKR